MPLHRPVFPCTTTPPTHPTSFQHIPKTLQGFQLKSTTVSLSSAKKFILKYIFNVITEGLIILLHSSQDFVVNNNRIAQLVWKIQDYLSVIALCEAFQVHHPAPP